MNIIQAVASGFNNIINFSDRASRSEFWWFVFFCFVVQILAAKVDENLLGGQNLFGTIASFVFFIPMTSMYTRRLHDVNRSGWWQLIMFTVIGILPLFYWLCKKGNVGANDYGSDPFDINSDSFSNSNLLSKSLEYSGEQIIRGPLPTGQFGRRRY